MRGTYEEPGITDKEKYGRYLCSRQWAEKREAVKLRAKGVCERCNNLSLSHVHHLTYIRKYNEQLNDLLGVCEGCHEFIHGKSNRDPVLEAPVKLLGVDIKSVYLAGRISGDKGDWRSDIVPAFQTSHGGGWCTDDGDYDSLVAVLPDGRKLSYSGPFWQEVWGHGSGGRGPHAMGTEPDLVYSNKGEVTGEFSRLEEPKFTAYKIASWMFDVDLVFAWLDSREAYGTLVEIGMSFGIKKNGGRILVVASPRWDRELWFPCCLATRFIIAESAGAAWNILFSENLSESDTKFIGEVNDAFPTGILYKQ